jgi:hypothetical protein
MPPADSAFSVWTCNDGDGHRCTMRIWGPVQIAGNWSLKRDIDWLNGIIQIITQYYSMIIYDYHIQGILYNPVNIFSVYLYFPFNHTIHLLIWRPSRTTCIDYCQWLISALRAASGKGWLHQLLLQLSQDQTRNSCGFCRPGICGQWCHSS